MSTKTPSLFGGAMIIAGTVIGAGMLANPTATSGVWFTGSLAVLLYTWFSMLSSGLMILEVNTHYPHGASFDTMVKDLLGRSWNIINGIAVAFVLYLLTYAYIFVGGDLTPKGLGSAAGGDVSLTVGQLVFFGILAFCVWASARLVDRFTSVLIGGMVLTFIWATGGLIAAALTETAGSSAWFSRGYVTYANQAKIEMLGVDAATLEAEGAVSTSVASQMALGALRSSDALLSMAVSGIAGPDGGTAEKPVGTVCFGWALRWPPGTSEPLVLTETRHFSGDRADIRRQTAIHALWRAVQLLDQAQDQQPIVV